MKIVVSLFLLVALCNAGWMSTGFAKNTNPPKFAIELQYDGAGNFSEGLAAVKMEDKWGFIDHEGTIVIPPQKVDSVSAFKEGMAAVQLDGKYGFIDRTGAMVIKPVYDEVKNFSEGLAAVTKDYKYWGFIDKSGNIVIDFKYKVVSPFYKGQASAYIEGFFGVIDRTGKEAARKPSHVLSFNDHAQTYNEGLAVIFNGKYGYVDEEGSEVVQPIYDAASPFQEGLAVVGVSKEGAGFLYGVIDKSGKEIVIPQYSEIGGFQNGLASFTAKDNKVGFLDSQGNVAIKAEYERNYNNHYYVFREGLAAVRQSLSEEGFIDTKGNIIIPMQFDMVGEFSEGVAAVHKGGKSGYIINPLITPVKEDFPAGWAQAEVESAVSLNLIPNDMHNRFEQAISRGSFCKLVIHLLAEKTGKTVEGILAERVITTGASPFRDTTDETVLAANALGIVNGKDDRLFDPYGRITRQEAAVMLMRTAGILGLYGSNEDVSFADRGDIAGWAKEAVAFVSTTNDKTNQTPIMGDAGDNRFSPNASYTRQQAFITMKRLLLAF